MPMASGAWNAASAAALPPPEPPGTRSTSHGLRVGPNAEFSVDEPIANSSMLVLPRIGMPAARSRAVDRRVVGRRPALEDLRPAGGGHVGGGEDVLQRQRHPGQRRRQLLAGRDRGVDAGGRGQRLLLRDVQERVVLAVGVGDPVQAGPGHLGRRHLLGGDLGAQRRGVQPDQRRSLTRPPPESAGRRTGPRPTSGACASACSCDSHGSTTSGRVTLTAFSGLSVASTSVTSTAWIWPTCSRMASSWPAKLSSSSSVRASRARRARWATSSREIWTRLQA